MEQENEQPIQQTPTTPPQTKLVDIPITNENMALNVIISFVSLAQKRGAFSIEESSKIWECIRKFQKPEKNIDV
jgi:hypothetical protein